MNITVTDIDDGAYHTVSSGDHAAVAAEYPVGHPVRDLIVDVVATARPSQATYSLDGETYTTRVVPLVDRILLPPA